MSPNPLLLQSLLIAPYLSLDLLHEALAEKLGVLDEFGAKARRFLPVNKGVSVLV